MRWRGLAQSRDTFPPISQRPLRRSTTYQGQERSQCSGRDQVTGWLGASPRRGSGFPLCQRARGFPQAGWRRVFPQPVAQGFPLPIDRGFPQAKRLKSSLRRVAQGFLLITQLGVSPPPHNLKFSLRLRRRAFFSVRDSGFPLRHIPRSSPCATGPRFPLAGFPLARWHRAFPEAEGPRVCPIPGWPRVSPAPVAWSFLLAGGAGLLLARKPGVVLCRVARGFPFAGYRPWW